jgi:hypothetical protein
VAEGESLGVGKERDLGLVMDVLADVWSSAPCCMRLQEVDVHTFPDRALE